MPQSFSPPWAAPPPEARKAKEPPAAIPQGVDEIADSRTPSPAFLNQKPQGESAISVLNTTSGDSETTRCLRGRQASVLLTSWDRGFPPGTLTKQELGNQQGGKAQAHRPTRDMASADKCSPSLCWAPAPGPQAEDGGGSGEEHGAPPPPR